MIAWYLGLSPERWDMSNFTVWVSSDSNKGRGASNRASFQKRGGLNLSCSDSSGYPKGTSHVSQFVHITPHDPDRLREPSCFMIIMHTHAEDTTPGFYLSPGLNKLFPLHLPSTWTLRRSYFPFSLNLSFPFPSHGIEGIAIASSSLCIRLPSFFSQLMA